MSIIDKIDSTCIYVPHPRINIGYVKLPECESHEISISPGCQIDITGIVYLSKWCMIGAGTQIWTHDHYHIGRTPLLLLQEQLGVKWLDKRIGQDVWLHGCIVLMQCEEIADGCVVGAGSVVTKNLTEPYGIYAGNPAVKIGER